MNQAEAGKEVAGEQWARKAGRPVDASDYAQPALPVVHSCAMHGPVTVPRTCRV
jgi:hypothetical protein